MNDKDLVKLLESEIDKLHGSEQPAFSIDLEFYDGNSGPIITALKEAYEIGRSAGRCPCCNCPDCSGRSVIG